MTSADGAIGILGGSFSPPHTGHVLAAHYALLRWKLAKILVVPSFKHPFGKTLPAFEYRLAMCELAFSHLGNHVEISDLERQMGGVSYTIETVRHLLRKNPENRYRLIVGGDILSDVAQWREFDELTRLAPLLVIPRSSGGKIQGGEPAEAALPDVDSTSIRRRIAEGLEPCGVLPAKVMEYIRLNRLYLERD